MTVTEIIQSLRYRTDEDLTDNLFSQAEKLDALNQAQVEMYTQIDPSLFVDNVAWDDYSTQTTLDGNWFLQDILRVERQDTETSEFIRCSLISPYDYSQYLDNSYSTPTIDHPIAVHWVASTSISDDTTPATTGGLRVYPLPYNMVRVYYRMRPKNITADDVIADIEIILGNKNASVGFDTVEPLHHILIHLAEAQLWKNDNNPARSDLAKSRAMESITALNQVAVAQAGKPING